MSPAVVAGSTYLPSELPVNDNPWCPDLPCLSHVYQLSHRALASSSDRILCFSSAAISRDFVLRSTGTETSVGPGVASSECRFTFFDASNFTRLLTNIYIQIYTIYYYYYCKWYKCTYNSINSYRENYIIRSFKNNIRKRIIAEIIVYLKKKTYSFFLPFFTNSFKKLSCPIYIILNVRYQSQGH